MGRTEVSRVFAEAVVVEHGERQMYAAMRVLMFVRGRHRAETVARHERRLLRALVAEGRRL